MKQTLENSNRSLESYGTDTYVLIKYKELETYLGLNHTIAKQGSGEQKVYVPFNPQDKLSITIAYEIEGKWRLGAEACYTANQYIYNNEKVPNFFFLAAMIERKIKRWSLVLNCENLLDRRQSSFEKLFTGSLKQPVFRPIWGPLEGRVINFSVKTTF